MPTPRAASPAGPSASPFLLSSGGGASLVYVLSSCVMLALKDVELKQTQGIAQGETEREKKPSMQVHAAEAGTLVPVSRQRRASVMWLTWSHAAAKCNDKTRSRFL